MAEEELYNGYLWIYKGVYMFKNMAMFNKDVEIDSLIYNFNIE